MIVAEDAQGARIQQKMLTATCRQPNPARRQHAQHVSVREQRDVAVDGAGPGYHPIDPGAHLLGRLAARASVPEDQPVRRDLVDLLRRQSLVHPVVPLDQVGVNDRLITEPR